MIESVINIPLTLTSNSSVVTFQEDRLRTRSANCCGFLQHSEGSPIYKIIEKGIYEVSFDGTVTSATAGIVALGILEDGVVVPSSVGAETLATAGDLANISIRDAFRVCCNGNTSITIASIPSVLAGATLVPTDTEVPIITNGNLIINKIS